MMVGQRVRFSPGENGKMYDGTVIADAESESGVVYWTLLDVDCPECLTVRELRRFLPGKILPPMDALGSDSQRVAILNPRKHAYFGLGSA